ncbi:CBFD_NFYB_HMF domain-containing protein/Aminotran_4 domain-containing protein, partial [Cephalotus follicularis]
MQMASSRFLFSNGILSHSSDTPCISTFLATHQGAYTTSRTHNNGSCLLYWQRHLQRLANSARILLNLNPHLISSSFSLLLKSSKWESVMDSLVNESVNKVLTVALKERSAGKELAVTALVVCSDLEKLNGFDGERFSEIIDVHVHVGNYVPPGFGLRGNGASLALVGRGRNIAAAKYSDWVRLRKPLEKLRPPSVTELLLSNDGDQILEGCVTNFFVVCRKDDNKVEVQTAPISDGVLPGIIRQLVIEVCLSKGIPLREVAPSWSEHEHWEEAFVTSSLRIVQHVDAIQVPTSLASLESKLWNEISWKERRFEEGPGMITKIIQMADGPGSPAGGSHESGGEQSPRAHGGVREQDRYLPIANISRIMKKALPVNGKIAKDAKDTVQECVSEFISFITSEASDKCSKEKRKTINGDDLLWAMATLGFEDYIEPLKVYLARYREGDTKGSARGGDGSAKRDGVGALPNPNAQ